MYHKGQLHILSYYVFPIFLQGMVVARIVKGNIPVENGVVHLIDKPLMIVDGSMFEYLMVNAGC